MLGGEDHKDNKIHHAHANPIMLSNVVGAHLGGGSTIYYYQYIHYKT
jgi:hypothetical protein